MPADVSRPTVGDGSGAPFAVSRDGLVELAGELIRVPSLSGREGPAAQRLAAALASLGWEDVSLDAKNNVIGWLRGPRPGPTLMLNGHIDHAPPGLMADPYGGQEVDGQLYGTPGRVLRGRGAVDMKGALASMAWAGVALRRAGGPRRGALVFVANTFEEVSTAEGINEVFLVDGVKADMAVCGEATNLGIYLGHRGMVEVKVSAVGRTSHASNPSLGLNAIRLMRSFLETLDEAASGWPTGHFLGDVVATPIDISASPGRDAPIVPDRCSLHIDRRFLPGETPEAIAAQMRELVEQTRRRHPDFRAEVEILRVFPSLWCQPEQPVVSALKRARRQVLGEAGPLGRWLFGTDGAFISGFGVPCAGFGPGDERFAHTPEDHVPVDDLLAAAQVYAAVAADILSEGDDPR
jgi:putative selenium metabolism hydrolase